MKMKLAITTRLLVLMTIAFAPAFAQATTILMNAGDTSGQSSFNSGLHWANGLAPAAGTNYDTTPANLLRTPSGGSTPITFAGDSLQLSGPGTTAAGGGRLNWTGTTGGDTTINNLIVTNLGMLQNGGTSGKTWVLAGALTIQADAVNSFGTNGCIFLTGNGPILVKASISGSGAICRGTPSAGANGNNVILAGDLSGFTGNIITTDHHVTCPVTVSNVTDQTISGVISILDSFTKRGSAKLTLTGTNTYAGVTTNSGGTLVLAGNEIGVTNATVVSSGATLQLQANSTNIVSGTSYALGTLATAGNQFNVGSTIQFRSDSSVTFNGGENLGGVGNGINSWDVNQVTGAGANNTITFAPDGFSVFNSTFNITGGNGYVLSVGPMNLISTSGTLTLNASNANLIVNGITSAGASGLTTVLGTSNTTISAAITATTSLTKQGTGILTLNGANSYSGSTLIQTGTVFLASGTTLASTNLNVSAGATLDAGALGGPLALNASQYLDGSGKVNGSVDTASGGLIYSGGNFVAGTLTVTTNLTLSSGGTLSFDLAHNTAIGGGTNDLIVVGGNLNVAGSTTLALNFLNGSPATGTYTLIQYGTISGDTTLASITLPINARYSLILSNDTVHKAVELVVSGVPGNLVWLGNGSDNAWDNAGGYQNWTNTGSFSRDYFYDGDNATFNDTGSDSPAIYLTTVNSPGSLVVNATQTYDFTGSGGIAGVTSLNKSGSGTLILETANSYSGLTIINSGTVQIGNVNASGALGTGAVTNNGTLAFDRTDGIGVANDLHGTGSLIYNGTGSVTPTSVNNDYTGSTVVNNGILYATTSAAFGQSSGTTVNNGGQVYITANVNIGAEPMTLAGVGDGNGALRKGGAGATTYGGALTLSSNTTIVVDGGATLTLTNVAGIAGASNALVIVGGGTLTLGGPVSLGTNALTASVATLNLNRTNFYSGGTTLTAGIVNVNTNGALGSGPVTATTTGRFVIGTGLNITNSFTATTVNPGAATGFLMTPDNTNGTVTTVSGPIGFNDIAISGGHFAGPTSSGYLNVPGVITMPASIPMVIRLGNLRFSGGSGSYYTEIQPRANTTSIGANNGIATNAVMDLAANGAAYFDLNGFSQRLAGLKNTITPANAGISFVTNSSATAGTLTLDLGTGNSFSFGGHIVGNQSLVMASGQQVLTGTNNYTGNTTVNGGTLELALPTLFTNSTVSVANGATLQLDFSETNTVAAFVSNGVSQVAGVYSAATSSPYITGSGYLLVQSSGPTLPGIITNSLSGNTLSLTWPAGQGWRLIGQTNGLTTGLGTNWGTVTGGSDGSISITIDPNKPTVFYRLVYP